MGTLLLRAQRNWQGPALVSALQPVFQISDAVGSFGSSRLQFAPEKSSAHLSGVTKFPGPCTKLDQIAVQAIPVWEGKGHTHFLTGIPTNHIVLVNCLNRQKRKASFKILDAIQFA